jgi:uncharacterized protein
MTDLIVFLKAPVPGTVKTRLQTRYSPEEAATLYRAFIHDGLETSGKAPVDRRIAAYSGDVSVVKDIVPSDWILVPQIEAELGERMLAALNASIVDGADKAILIGTDIPSLPADHICSAIARLDSAEVVLGPTTDGGFYLIGTRVGLPDALPGIVWSTDRVFEDTSEAIQSVGLQLSLIPPWGDVDTPEDLDLALSQSQSTMTHTRAAVSGINR